MNSSKIIEDGYVIKVTLKRNSISNPDTPCHIFRSLENPDDLRIHLRPGEGIRPIFDREGIIVNKEYKEDIQEERMVLSLSVTGHSEQKSSSRQAATSKSSARSRVLSSLEKSPEKFGDKKRSSPQSHNFRQEPSKDYKENSSSSSLRYRRSGSNSHKTVYQSRRTPSPSYRTNYKPTTYHRYSRSPPRYRRSASRSPPSPLSSHRRRSRSPRALSRGVRSRSRSRSRQDYKSRSSPRKHFSSECSSRRLPPRLPQIPNPYFQRAEFWNFSLQPRLFIPPGPFPYRPPLPFRPMMPPFRFRAKIVYNTSGARRLIKTVTPETDSVVTASQIKNVSKMNEDN